MEALVVPATHDPGEYRPVPSRVVAEWPVGTFLENLLPRTDGEVWVAVHSANALEAVDPDTGARRTVAAFSAPVAGLAEAGGAVWAHVGDVGAPSGAVYRVAEDGATERWIEIEGSLFLNGLAALSPIELLSVDSLRGRIVRVDLAARTAVVWLEDARLAKVTDNPMKPGANGIKVYDGAATVTNTDRSLVLRIPIRGDGNAGEPEGVAERLNGDDIAYDAEGDLYVAIHLGTSLLRLRRDGTREDLARDADGMAGSTACAFARDSAHAGTLYVTTTGGIVAPIAGRVQPAKLVALSVGAKGAKTWA